MVLLLATAPRSWREFLAAKYELPTTDVLRYHPPISQLGATAMNPPRAAIAAVLLAVSAACAVTRPAARQDVVKVAGASHAVIFENDRVRVLSVHFKPGQVAPMHSHPDNVSYFITGGKLKITMPDGKTIERSPKAG